MPSPRTVLLTGAAGGVGTLMRELLPRYGYELRLLDLQPVEGEPGSLTLDIGDPGARGALREAVRGVDAVLHLAGISVVDLSGPSAHVARARAEEVRDSLTALVVVGGDGTVSLGAEIVAGTPVRLGIVPAGSGNDFARSLGLSYGQSLRHVVLPQAVRRVVPPLMNDAISLQKDSGLIAVLGVIDAIQAARIETARDFNFTPYVVAGFLFICLTIPMARFTDWVARKQGFQGAGGNL